MHIFRTFISGFTQQQLKSARIIAYSLCIYLFPLSESTQQAIAKLQTTAYEVTATQTESSEQGHSISTFQDKASTFYEQYGWHVLISNSMLLTTVILLLIFSRNISKRKIADTKFQKLFDEAPVGILVTSADGQILEFNKAMHYITGHTEEDLSNLHAHNFYRDLNDRKKILERLDNNLSIKNIETVFRHKDGHHLDVSLTAVPFKMKYSNAILTIVQDISENRRNLQELVVAKEKAEESDLLKSAFLAAISHEIRTPLNAIVGFSTLIAENSDAPKLNHFSSSIKTQNDLLLKLIDNLIDYARMESNSIEISKQSFEPTTLLEEIHLLHEESCKRKHIRLVYQPPEYNILIASDEHRIRQVFTNLISNAIKFTPNGQITFGYEMINSYTIQGFVKDTGIGIQKSDHQKIFERFVKLDSFTQGAGLGLTIVKYIIEMLDGEIRIESNKSGTAFYFTIPLEQQIEILGAETTLHANF